MKKNAKSATEVVATSQATENNFPNQSNEVTANEQTNSPEQVAEVLTEQREAQPKSLKEIIEKHQKIARFLEKRQSIDEASKTLDSFNLGSAKMQDTLTIKDGRGNIFTTSKTDLIEDAITFLKNRVEVKTAEVEAELLQLEAA